MPLACQGTPLVQFLTQIPKTRKQRLLSLGRRQALVFHGGNDAPLREAELVVHGLGSGGAQPLVRRAELPAQPLYLLASSTPRVKHATEYHAEQQSERRESDRLPLERHACYDAPGEYRRNGQAGRLSERQPRIGHASHLVPHEMGIGDPPLSVPSIGFTLAPDADAVTVVRRFVRRSK